MTPETITGRMYLAELDRAAQSLTIRLRANGQAVAQINGHLLAMIATAANSERHGNDGSEDRLDAFLSGLALGAVQINALSDRIDPPAFRPIATPGHTLQPATLVAMGKAAEAAAKQTRPEFGSAMPADALTGARIAGPYDKALAALEQYDTRGTIPSDDLPAVLEELAQYADYLQEEEDDARRRGDAAGELHRKISEWVEREARHTGESAEPAP